MKRGREETKRMGEKGETCTQRKKAKLGVFNKMDMGMQVFT